MGRKHTCMDRAFGRPDYDPDDAGEFVQKFVFVMMSFTGAASKETYVPALQFEEDRQPDFVNCDPDDLPYDA